MKSQITLIVGLVGFVIVLALALVIVLAMYRAIRKLARTLPELYDSAHWLLKVLWPRRTVLLLTALIFVFWVALELAAFVSSTKLSEGVITTILEWPAYVYDGFISNWPTQSLLSKVIVNQLVLFLFAIVGLLNFYCIALILYWFGRGVKKLTGSLSM